jgi:hypothetical protein
MTCIVAAGSILHDMCCADNAAGRERASGCNGAQMVIVGSNCDAEWQEAIWDDVRGFYWWVEYDTRERWKADDVRLKLLAFPPSLDRWKLRAPPNQVLGGTRVSIVPGSPEDVLVTYMYGRRTQQDWQKLCQSRAVSDSWADWARGLVYCE